MKLLFLLTLLQFFPMPFREPINHDQLKRDLSDNGVSLCRLMFHSNRHEQGGRGWATDYPKAEKHLQIRLGEMTTTRSAEDTENDPIFWVVEANSPHLFRCPLLLGTDVGTLDWQPGEVESVRNYLGKGGMLWVDDFWGPNAWKQWEHAFAQIIPGGYIKLLPLDHSIFHIHYRVIKVPQISNLNYWQNSGGMVSERNSDSPKAELLGGFTSDGTLAVIMTYNTDIADAAEREADSAEYFDRFAHEGYALMINIILYSLTH